MSKREKQNSVSLERRCREDEKLESIRKKEKYEALGPYPPPTHTHIQPTVIASISSALLIIKRILNQLHTEAMHK